MDVLKRMLIQRNAVLDEQWCHGRGKQIAMPLTPEQGARCHRRATVEWIGITKVEQNHDYTYVRDLNCLVIDLQPHDTRILEHCLQQREGLGN